MEKHYQKKEDQQKVIFSNTFLYIYFILLLLYNSLDFYVYIQFYFQSKTIIYNILKMLFAQIRSFITTFVSRISKSYIMKTNIALQIIDVYSSFKQSKWTTKKLIASFLGLYYIDVIYNTSIELHFQKTQENEQLLQSCPSLTVIYSELHSFLVQSRYMPTLYLPTAFLQLLWQSVFDPEIVPFTKREKLYLHDGGLVALDWMHNDSKNIIIVCHGMTGGGDQNYVKQVVHSLYKQGFTAVCFNQRGVSGLRLATSKYLNMTCPQDLKEVIELIKRRYPHCNLYGVGISIGSNLILRYAGQEGKNCLLKGIVSIANPYDLEVRGVLRLVLKQEDECEANEIQELHLPESSYQKLEVDAAVALERDRRGGEAARD